MWWSTVTLETGTECTTVRITLQLCFWILQYVVQISFFMSLWSWVLLPLCNVEYLSEKKTGMATKSTHLLCSVLWRSNQKHDNRGLLYSHWFFQLPPQIWGQQAAWVCKPTVSYQSWRHVQWLCNGVWTSSGSVHWFQSIILQVSDGDWYLAFAGVFCNIMPSVITDSGASTFKCLDKPLTYWD